MLHSFFLHASLTVVLFFASQSEAFFPTDFRENIVGNGGVSHIKQTERVWKELALHNYFPFIKPEDGLTKPMETAMKIVTDANAGVDDNQHESALHFDGESFIDGQIRLSTLRKAVKDSLTAKDATNARKSLGAALHTLQDFYAHSNWIELGNRGPHPLLGSGTVLDFAGPLDDTCTSCSGAVGAFVFNTIIYKTQLWNLAAKAVGAVIGAVTNKEVVVPGVRACENCGHNSDITGKLTSGYYYGEDRPPQTGKCHHGGYFDTPLSTLSDSKVIEGVAFVAGSLYLPPTGINKDSLACDWSPHSFYHSDAVTASQLATAKFIDEIASEITFGQLELLFGVGTTLAFVMDTTGSMRDIQASVTAEAIQIATDRLGSTDNVDLFIISPFNDPTTGPVQLVTDLPVFKSIMDNLPAFGGGDCPELSLTGILNAIQQVTKATRLILFTDAAAKDFALEDQVISAALAKDVHIEIFKFDSTCDDGLTKRVDSASNRVYGSLAAATGGSYHSLPRNNVGSITSLLEVLTAGNTNPILKISDTAGATPKTYTFSVDSLMTQVSISLSGAGAILAYNNIGGAIPVANVNTVDLADGKHITITSPPPGKWEVTITGNGSFNLVISGLSPLHFSVFDFVESRGRPGHTGYFPIADLPPYNVDIGVIARLFGSFNSASFELRRPNGSPITTLPVTPGSGEEGFPDTGTFFGVLRLPNEPFYVYATGVDGSGQPFQRLLDTVVSPVFSDTPYHIGTLEPLELNATLIINPTNGTSNGTLTNGTLSGTGTGGQGYATTLLGPYTNATSSSKAAPTLSVNVKSVTASTSTNVTPTSAIPRQYSVTEIVYTTTTICPISDQTTALTVSTITLTSTVTNRCTQCIPGIYTSYNCDCKPGAGTSIGVPTSSKPSSAAQTSSSQPSGSPSQAGSGTPGKATTSPVGVSPGSPPSATLGEGSPAVSNTFNAKSTSIAPILSSQPSSPVGIASTGSINIAGGTSSKPGVSSSNPSSPSSASGSSASNSSNMTSASNSTAAQAKPTNSFVSSSISASDLERNMFWALVGYGIALWGLVQGIL